MTKITKTEAGYFMNEDGKISEKLKVNFDKRKGCGDIVLPENAYGRKYLSESRFTDGITEIDLGNIPSRAKSTGAKKAEPIKSWENFIDKADLEAFKAIKDKALKNQERAEKLAEIESYKAKIAEIEAFLNPENPENPESAK